MSTGLQAKLLRVLQEREIEPIGGSEQRRGRSRDRATNRDLRQLVDEGRFQDDLFYRLHVIPIVVPPLRDRVDDIPMLVMHFVDKQHTKRKIDRGAGRRCGLVAPGLSLARQRAGARKHDRAGRRPDDRNHDRP